MRLRFVSRQLGFVLLLLSVCMIPSALAACYYHLVEHAPGAREALLAMAVSAAIGGLVSAVLIYSGRGAEKQMGRREALLLVALTWVVGAALAAMPFWIWAQLERFEPGEDDAFVRYVNCYFESMSGLTTTGSSVLSHVESIPRSLLLWRSFIQWLGGLGIVVLFVAVLPILGVGGKRMFRFEAPGPKKEGVRPRIRAAAQMLWIIYVGITGAEVLMLKGAGLTWFNSFCHAFTTMATGGFSTSSASISGLGHWRFEIIIVLFMFMAGVNFSLYDQVLSGRWRSVLKNPEWRAYVGVILVATLLIFVMAMGRPVPIVIAGQADEGLWSTLRHSLFTVVSLQTTTGFCTADFDQWSFPAKCILVSLMFIGGCAGSTGGGIKVIRFVVLAKVLLAELEAVFRPHVVRTVRVGTSTVDSEMRSATLIYFLLFALIVTVSTSLVLAFEPSSHFDNNIYDASVTAFSAVAATLNNIGPGLDLVGPTHNYFLFTDATKILLSLLMALGRLELYAFLVLLVPAFWREE